MWFPSLGTRQLQLFAFYLKLVLPPDALLRVPLSKATLPCSGMDGSVGALSTVETGAEALTSASPSPTHPTTTTPPSRLTSTKKSQQHCWMPFVLHCDQPLWSSPHLLVALPFETGRLVFGMFRDSSASGIAPFAENIAWTRSGG